MKYSPFYQQSIKQPETFWKEQSEEIAWYKKPNNILTKDENNYPLWFEDGELNMCYLAIDKHIEDGFGNQTAIVFDSPVTQTIEKYTYFKLQEEVAKLAGGLQSLGLKKGNTAVIYMPMIPQAAFAMLACARLGVTHSVVFGGFAPAELAIRIDDCKPKIIITASSGIEIDRLIAYKPLVDEAIALAAHQPKKVVVLNRKFGAKVPFKKWDVDYAALVYGSDPVACVPVSSNHALYILYTSGTTGKPKGIVRDTGGYATALQFSMKYIYGVAPGEVFWAASDVGWVVGHSYIVYAPLIHRNTTVIFEGKPIKTPDASTFWRVISEHKVSVMFTAPTAIRAIKKEDPDGDYIKKYDLSCLRTQFLAGERCDIATIEWYKKQLDIPVIDHWWQTESGWPMIAIMMGVEPLLVKFGSAGKAVCGYSIHIFDENGKELAPNEEGYVVVKLPLPPGTMLDLWKDYERFESGYLKKFPGYYLSGDGGYIDEDGYVFITGRIDDVINVAGHRLSTAEMEEVVSSHPQIAECAVVGVHDTIKGQIPIALIVTRTDTIMEEFQIEYEIIQLIRNKIGALASLKNVIKVDRLPKTRSGKTLRKLIRSILDKNIITIPSTIDDETIVEEIKEKCQAYFASKSIA
ncbi:MAG: propionyl-CoA synthetase [Flavobacteriaceae bacterium CG_4_8_14_3_um_filter_34_10]|nr:propionyl-CoA synthetase [Flavobacteriia bacterium]OIP51641.1 MAG: propionyl-CoA synthetase [Flavobacteriaceae bacterium CG2_30_34_30]PIQ17262.1 MAG: propionyl-CoA synthetase [Flavobacteriaceae bacterium CG18_big_fil_WC_8_21_14_2_50_34_36]PIV48586.1 MAG: propionyl-CoA synthetase [Flavobacteriaceae bacterium CG02_land_8_20_14_3_00_34_13]PIX10086.1 MAG: propionyl-CoA synthetase [Flavobacteriaceae bacterium CG_4_8_14_3_um_filter_34_10]PIZ07030.1 MAG: propionyl-CoA synthetase [Flavobacteriaceae